MALKTLEDGLIDGLKDLYSAENQLLKALPKMAKKADSESLKEAIEAHIEETQTQVERLSEVANLLGKKLTGKTCKAMQGLIEEGKEVMEEKSENAALIDCMLIGAAQRVEHYEIAAYEGVIAIAEELGESEIVKLLQETLEEENETSSKLTALAADEILSAANEFGAEDEEAEEEEEEEPTPKKSTRGNGRGKSMEAR